MEISMYASKGYSEHTERVAFQNWDDEISMRFIQEPSEENDYDGNERDVRVNLLELKKGLLLISEMPTLQTSLAINYDSWNTHTSERVNIRRDEGKLVLEVGLDTYRFNQEELLAIVRTLS